MSNVRRHKPSAMSNVATFDAPLLEAGQSTLRWQLEVGIVYHARQVPNLPDAGRLLFAYLVITDKAMREYSAGHKRISEHMSKGGDTAAYVEGVGDFENCINATKRALRLLKRLAEHPNGPELNRTSRRIADVWSNQVTDVRDAIEHIDNGIISKTGLPDGSAHMLTINAGGTQLEIGSHNITFIALAATLQSLFRAGKEIIQALPTPPETT